MSLYTIGEVMKHDICLKQSFSVKWALIGSCKAYIVQTLYLSECKVITSKVLFLHKRDLLDQNVTS